VFGRLGPWTTVEEEWQDNRPFISCIPASPPEGYLCKRVQSPKFGNTFEVTSVPGRTHILFHVFNTEEGSLGCIGMGVRLGVLRVTDEDSGEKVWKLAATSSGVAIKSWLKSMEEFDEFMLHIVGWEGEDYGVAR
jgi:hypothetical protein